MAINVPKNTYRYAAPVYSRIIKEYRELNMRPKQVSGNKGSMVKTVLGFYYNDKSVINPELYNTKVSKLSLNEPVMFKNNESITLIKDGRYPKFEIISKCQTQATKKMYRYYLYLLKRKNLNKVGMGGIKEIGRLKGIKDIIEFVKPIFGSQGPKVTKITSHFICETTKSSQYLHISASNEDARNFFTNILEKI